MNPMTVCREALRAAYPRGWQRSGEIRFGGLIGFFDAVYGLVIQGAISEEQFEKQAD